MSPGQVDTILYRLDHQDELLREINDRVGATNGRVKALELWKARLDGASLVVGKVGPLATGALGAVIGAVVTHLLG